MPRRVDSPYVFTLPCGRRLSKSSHYYYWRLLRTEAGRAGMDFYELRHFCATHLLELGVSHADVAVQLGHTDGGALVMSTYGHPSVKASLARVLEAYSRDPARRLKAVGD
ncbi:MAG TPA: tyrosine-type recombinase/integrase [Solirubrobacteraceae bacterium]|nr:tyrosine-type recombinase/integrase [Solirubrobacteraceae bacterium]